MQRKATTMVPQRNKRELEKPLPWGKRPCDQPHIPAMSQPTLRWRRTPSACVSDNTGHDTAWAVANIGLSASGQAVMSRFILYTLCFISYTSYLMLYTLYFMLYTLYFMLYTLYFMLYILYFTPYALYSILDALYFT